MVAVRESTYAGRSSPGDDVIDVAIDVTLGAVPVASSEHRMDPRYQSRRSRHGTCEGPNHGEGAAAAVRFSVSHRIEVAGRARAAEP